jgi:hypothetical protein
MSSKPMPVSQTSHLGCAGMLCAGPAPVAATQAVCPGSIVVVPEGHVLAAVAPLTLTKLPTGAL